MTGYVKPYLRSMPRPLRKEYRLFYCTLCKTLQAEYGLPGMACLTYELTALLLLAAALDEEPPPVFHGACSLTPFYPVFYTDYMGQRFQAAASVSVVMAEGEAADDLQDEGSLKAWVAGRLLHRASEKARGRLESACDGIDQALGACFRLEEEGASLEELMEGSGKLAQSMLHAMLWTEAKLGRENLLPIAHDLGAWVYLMDAMDDRQKDHRRGSFNPLENLPEGTDPAFLAEKLERSIAAAIETLPLRRYQQLIQYLLGQCLSRTRQESGRT